MKTKRIINYIGMICFGAVLMGCARKEDLQEIQTGGLNSPVQFNASILKAPATRTGAASDNAADRTQFKTGDTISFLDTKENKFVEYVKQENKWIAVEGKPVLWTSDNMNFVLYSPAEACNLEYKIPVDQSTEEKLEKADLKKYNKVRNVNEGVIDIAFERQTARIVIEPHFNMEFGDVAPTIDEISVAGNIKRVQVSKIEHKIITPYLKDGKYILLTNELENSPEDVFIRLKCTDSKGMKYTYEVKGIPEIRSSRSYLFHLYIGKNTIKTGSIDFEDWDAATENIPGGEAVRQTIVNPETHLIINAYPGEITTEMLKTALAGGTEIHISGPLNGADLKCIREAAGCASDASTGMPHAAMFKKLYMSDAIIIGGNEPYATDNGVPLTTTSNHIGKCLFYDSKITDLKLPDSATIIESDAISGGLITNLDLPKNLETIENSGINSLNDLFLLKLPEGLKTISDRAIIGTRINIMAIPASVTSIGEGLDYLNNEITEIRIDGTKRTRPDGTDIFDENWIDKTKSVNYDLRFDKSWTPDIIVKENDDLAFKGAVWKYIFYLDGSRVFPEDIKPDFSKSPEVTGHAVQFSHAGIVAGTEEVAITDGLTYEALVKFNSFNDNNTIMGVEQKLLLRVGDVKGGLDNNLAQVYIGNSTMEAQSKNALKTGVWYHLAFTYDCKSGNCILYINGAEIASTYARGWEFTIGGTSSNGTGLYVGLIPGYINGERPFDGMMKEVRIWTKSRTQQEISNNMLSVDPNSQGLIRYYKLDGNDIQSSSVTDASGHSNGTIVKQTNYSNGALTKVNAN